MAASQSDIEELRRVESILAIGATSVVVDGRTVTYDLESLRLRRKELRNRIDGLPNRVVRTIDLSRAF